MNWYSFDNIIIHDIKPEYLAFSFLPNLSTKYKYIWTLIKLICNWQLKEPRLFYKWIKLASKFVINEWMKRYTYIYAVCKLRATFWKFCFSLCWIVDTSYGGVQAYNCIPPYQMMKLNMKTPSTSIHQTSPSNHRYHHTPF